ncbi:MAG: methyltransferase domain-containing protein [Zavarzinella sp.]
MRLRYDAPGNKPEPTPTEPQIVETPAAAISEHTTEIVIIDRFRFHITRPADSYELLDDPLVRAAHEVDDYMPYWADLWPASRMLAKSVAKEDWSRFPHKENKLHALELGCGLGIPGLTALACGLHVTFTDYDLAPLKFVEQNARKNKLFDFQTKPLDWRFPWPDQQFSVILGADLTYEMRNIEPLVGLLKVMLAPGGIALFTDQDRTPAGFFRETLVRNGFRYEQSVVKAGEPGGIRLQGSLYRIQHHG